MELKQVYVSAISGPHPIMRPFDFWFEFIVGNKIITREDYHDMHKYYPSNWRDLKLSDKAIYIGPKIPQEAMTESVSHIFSRLVDYKKSIVVVDNFVYTTGYTDYCPPGLRIGPCGLNNQDESSELILEFED